MSFKSKTSVLDSFFQFFPVSSGRNWKKLEETAFFQFLPGVREEIGFFRKKPNPADNGFALTFHTS